MPSGYTAMIKNTTTLAEFALICARNMGPLMFMRDDAYDVPIPEEISFNGGHLITDIERLHSEVDRWLNMSDEEALRERDAEVKKVQEERAAVLHDIDLKKQNYERLLTQVRLWNPPSDQHRPLRDFMLEQLDDSIAFDCWSAKERESYMNRPIQYVGLSSSAYKTAKANEAHVELLRMKKTLAQEQDRVRRANEWLQALRANLENLK